LPLPFFFFLAPPPGTLFPPPAAAAACGPGSTPSIASAASVVAPAEADPSVITAPAGAVGAGGGGGVSDVPAIFSNKSVLSAVKRFRVMLLDVVCLNVCQGGRRCSGRVCMMVSEAKECEKAMRRASAHVFTRQKVSRGGGRTDVHVVRDLKRQLAVDRPELDRVACLPRDQANNKIGMSFWQGIAVRVPGVAPLSDSTRRASGRQRRRRGGGTRRRRAG
jgi:hypothetical protein